MSLNVEIDLLILAIYLSLALAAKYLELIIQTK